MGGESGGHILILTGPPGTGKTSTAKALSARSARPAVHLHADDFWRFIGAGRISPYRPEAHEQNRVVMNALAASALAYAEGGYFVILDGIIGPWFLDSFAGPGVPIHYVILRASLATTLQRARGRKESDAIASGPIAALHQQFSELGPLEGHVIDTDLHDPEQSFDAVIEALRLGRHQLAPAGWEERKTKAPRRISSFAAST